MADVSRMTSQTGTPRSTARWINNCTVLLPSPRAGVLITRSSETSSLGCSIHFK